MFEELKNTAPWPGVVLPVLHGQVLFYQCSMAMCCFSSAPWPGVVLPVLHGQLLFYQCTMARCCFTSAPWPGVVLPVLHGQVLFYKLASSWNIHLEWVWHTMKINHSLHPSIQACKEESHPFSIILLSLWKDNNSL